jgi:hypothetical protein
MSREQDEVRGFERVRRTCREQRQQHLIASRAQYQRLVCQAMRD